MCVEGEVEELLQPGCGGASEDDLEICFLGLQVLGHSCHIYGIWKSKEVGDSLKR